MQEKLVFHTASGHTFVKYAVKNYHCESDFFLFPTHHIIS
jgi:hypothetical protein